MRWFFVAVMAALLGLAFGGVAQACGCCGKCSGGAAASCPGGNCPNCPSPAGGGACPNCPRSTASFAPSRYWDSAYGCYLFYDKGTRASYYWSEAHRAYYPVSNAARPGRAVAASPPPSAYGTRYYSPAR